MSRSIIVPMYFWPEAHPDSWSAVITAAAYVGILIVNPNSGPGTGVISEFSDAVQRCQAANITVVGYVDSAYGAKSITDVQTEIDRYISWYQVDGFFIDDMYSSDTAEVAYYQQIHNIVKASSANKQLIFNPGQPMVPEAYLNTSDVFVTFEGSAESYTSFEPATYTNSYPPSRFYHIVYGADTSTTINSTLQQFSEQHAKWLYMTDLLEPNPYYDLPGNATWAALLDYMSSFTTQSVATGTSPSTAQPLGVPAAVIAGAASLMLLLLGV